MQNLTKITTKLSATLLVLFLGYMQVTWAESSTESAPAAQNKVATTGLYVGFYPCDDCHGIRTTLALNKSGTYVYISIYVGKSDREIVEKGKYSLNDKGDTLILIPRKGSTVTQQYLIDGDILIKLDEDGNRITKDGADGYILKQKDVVGSSGEHGGH